MMFREHQARHGGARHQHQQAGVRHVKAEGALRPASEIVVIEDQVLDDSPRCAERANGDHDVDGGQAQFARQQPVNDRDNDQQDELLGVDEADARIDGEDRRDERGGRVCRQRPEHPRHLDPLAVPHHQSDPEHGGNRQQDVGGGD